MNAQVKIIQDQQEEISNVEISQHEKEMLLGKYGFLNNQHQSVPQESPNNLTFEEMVAQSEEKRRSEMINRMMKINGPKPITFDGQYQSESKYDSDPESGLNFKIEIVTNMNLPK